MKKSLTQANFFNISHACWWLNCTISFYVAAVFVWLVGWLVVSCFFVWVFFVFGCRSHGCDFLLTAGEFKDAHKDTFLTSQGSAGPRSKWTHCGRWLKKSYRNCITILLLFAAVKSAIFFQMSALSFSSLNDCYKQYSEIVLILLLVGKDHHLWSGSICPNPSEWYSGIMWDCVIRFGENTVICKVDLIYNKPQECYSEPVLYVLGEML